MERIVLNGHNLTIKDLVKVARENAQVEIAQESRDEINRVREYIEEHWITEDAPPTYGFNTGLGKLKDFTISMEENDEFQKRAIFSHAACVGLCRRKSCAPVCWCASMRCARAFPACE